VPPAASASIAPPTIAYFLVKRISCSFHRFAYCGTRSTEGG
jgi:hypothetical protein